MKISDLFTPEKNLDNKIRDLKQSSGPKPKEFDSDDLNQNYVKIMYEGMDLKGKTYPEIAVEQRKVNMKAFDRIIQDTFENKIKWEKFSNEKYYAKACICNAAGKEIVIPVMFCTRKHQMNLGFLYLGYEYGSCLNTTDRNLYKLATEYFKLKLKAVKMG